MIDTLRKHWPEFFMEACELFLFMVTLCLFVSLVEYPGSLIRQSIENDMARRGIMGTVMGLTAIGITYSPWGQQSGAHMNPAFTLAFYRLGKIQFWDMIFYVIFQFAGAVLGVLLVASLFPKYVSDPMINFAATHPGGPGILVAFVAEMLLAFLLMLIVLIVTNIKKISAYTGFFVGLCIFIYVTLESPLSGMSINPARSFASALPARMFETLWIYFLAPVAGMLLAGEVYVRHKGIDNIFCAKINHANKKRCIFFCGCHNHRLK